jgi:RES domain-containing protein
MRVWRICKAKFATAAFSGEGARLYAGRWNPVGTRMVYTSPSLALAAMEFFVHLDPRDAPDDLVSIAALIPSAKAAVIRIEIEDLPADWRATDHPALQKIGADWISANRSVALEVPSVAVEGESNVLLNPAHPAFPRIILEFPQPFHFDQRMFKRLR